jgi:hypothetical protein
VGVERDSINIKKEPLRSDQRSGQDRLRPDLEINEEHESEENN